MRKRKEFSREFKKEAVRLLEEGKKPGDDLARELGIRRNQLYKWKETMDTPKSCNPLKIIIIISNITHFYSSSGLHTNSYPGFNMGFEQ